MKFIYYERGGTRAPGVIDQERGAVLSLPAALGRPVSDLLEFIRNHTPEDIARLQTLLRSGGGAPIPLKEVHIFAPLQKPVHDILCVGKNYAEHIQEVSRALDSAPQSYEHPVFFAKRARSILGPGEPVEAHAALDRCLDYEVELAVIIGKSGRDIPLEQVEEHIFGYSVFNDFSARTLQRQHVQWFRGKSLDGFSAMGPAILHRSMAPLPAALEIRSAVNGEVRQQANTGRMIFSVAEIIHALSQGMTLEPGDIIATGTPSGVGMGFDPPRWLKAGDTVLCEIEGIGRLQNPIV